jgi:hypothetical protein
VVFLLFFQVIGLRRHIKHVKRNANSLAHGHAKNAVKNIINRIWIEENPPIIHDIVTLEQIALSI